jgi:hypothetical protein
VPETIGPVEVGNEENAADHHRREGDRIADPGEPAVLGPAEDVDQRRQEVAPAREPADEEVENDQPAPVR